MGRVSARPSRTSIVVSRVESQMPTTLRSSVADRSRRSGRPRRLTAAPHRRAVVDPGSVDAAVPRPLRWSRARRRYRPKSNAAAIEAARRCPRVPARPRTSGGRRGSGRRRRSPPALLVAGHSQPPHASGPERLAPTRARLVDLRAGRSRIALKARPGRPRSASARASPLASSPPRPWPPCRRRRRRRARPGRRRGARRAP